MAISIGAYTCPRSGTRGVFVISGGTPYVILRDGTTIRCFKKTNTSFGEQDSGDAPTCIDADCLDARCDGSLIHIVYYSAVDDVSYVTFNTGTDQWGTPEAVESGLDEPTVKACAISLDSNDKPHVVYTVDEAYHGTGYDQLKYKNKVGASWSAEERVSTGTQVLNQYPTVGHESDDRFVVVWYTNQLGFNCKHRSRSSAGSWDTEGVVTISLTGYGSITITSDNKKNVALTVGFNLCYEEGTSGANPTWSETVLDIPIGSRSIAANGTDLYAVYEETSLHDILLVARVSGSWGSPETIAEGTMSTPCIQDPTDATGFDYIWKNDTDGNVYWDEYSMPGSALLVDEVAKTHIANVMGVAARGSIGQINSIPW